MNLKKGTHVLFHDATNDDFTAEGWVLIYDKKRFGTTPYALMICEEYKNHDIKIENWDGYFERYKECIRYASEKRISFWSEKKKNQIELSVAKLEKFTLAKYFDKEMEINLVYQRVRTYFKTRLFFRLLYLALSSLKWISYDILLKGILRLFFGSPIQYFMSHIELYELKKEIHILKKQLTFSKEKDTTHEKEYFTKSIAEKEKSLEKFYEKIREQSSALSNWIIALVSLIISYIALIKTFGA